MIRYLAIATAIVVAFLAIATALGPKTAGNGARTKYVTATGTPGSAQRDLEVHPTPIAMTGDAPWALSALPECFKQLASRSGPPAFAEKRIARDAYRVPKQTRLEVADCVLEVGGDSAVVSRGEDRLTVPPVARFYVAGKHLILERLQAQHADVRIYALATGTPSFAPLHMPASP